MKQQINNEFTFLILHSRIFIFLNIVQSQIYSKIPKI